MKFRIQKLEQFKGEQAGIYSVYLEDEQETLFERFIKEMVSLGFSEKEIMEKLENNLAKEDINA